MERKCLQIMNQKGMGLIIYMILIFKVTYIISNIIRKLGWFRQQNFDYLGFFTKLILQ